MQVVTVPLHEHGEDPLSIYDTRRENLRLLCRRHGGKQKVALKLGHANASYISQLAGPNPTKKISEEVARDIEVKMDLEPGCMDVPGMGRVAAITKAPALAEPPADYTPPAKLTEQRLVDATQVVMAAAQRAGAPLPPSKIGELIALAYHTHRGDGGIDEDLIQKVVDILAR